MSGYSSSETETGCPAAIALRGIVALEELGDVSVRVRARRRRSVRRDGHSPLYGAPGCAPGRRILKGLLEVGRRVRVGLIVRDGQLRWIGPRGQADPSRQSPTISTPTIYRVLERAMRCKGIARPTWISPGDMTSIPSLTRNGRSSLSSFSAALRQEVPFVLRVIRCDVADRSLYCWAPRSNPGRGSGRGAAGPLRSILPPLSCPR